MTLLPPAQYDHPPAVPVVEHVLPFEVLQQWCGSFPKVGGTRGMGRPPAGQYFNGCSSTLVVEGKPMCFVWYLPGSDPRQDDVQTVIRHERAHCNGWPGDHPGGR